MDLKTLLDRTNDAINTIIRLDESTETGELLPPCIEGTHILFFIFLWGGGGSSKLLLCISPRFLFVLCNDLLGLSLVGFCQLQA